MSVVFIRQKDVDRLARTLLREIFDNLHDEYNLKEFKHLDELRKEFLNKLCVNYIYTQQRKTVITDEKTLELIKPFSGKILITDENKAYFEKSNNYDSKVVDEAMKDGSMDTIGIYDTIKFIKIDDESFADLHFKLKAFINIYDVFYDYYNYLK